MLKSKDKKNTIKQIRKNKILDKFLEILFGKIHCTVKFTIYRNIVHFSNI